MFKFIRLTASVVCALALLSFPSAIQTQTAFTPGREYTFYTKSATSQAKIITCSNPAFASIYKFILKSNLTGESTVYPREECSALELIAKYQAEILWTEQVEDTVNYYCYSTQFLEEVTLGEQRVNLHVAENLRSTAVGTPLIFGGF